LDIGFERVGLWVSWMIWRCLPPGGRGCQFAGDEGSSPVHGLYVGARAPASADPLFFGSRPSPRRAGGSLDPTGEAAESVRGGRAGGEGLVEEACKPSPGESGRAWVG